MEEQNTIQWCGRSVTVQEGLADRAMLERLVGSEFPWLCANDDTGALEVCCPEWYPTDEGDLDFASLGVNFEELLDRFIETFCSDGEPDDAANCSIAIKSLERALAKLKAAEMRLHET